MEPHPGNFGVRLRGLIEGKGLSLVQFAQAYGIAESQLHLWLKRDTPPLAKHWPRLAEFFGVSEGFIVSGTPAKSERAPEMFRETLGERPQAPYVSSGVARTSGEDANRRMELAARFASVREPTYDQCLMYFSAYLEEAARTPGGLGHAWVELNKHFPLAQLHNVQDPDRGDSLGRK